MKFDIAKDFVENFHKDKRFCYYDVCIWLSGVFFDSLRFIEGEVTDDIGEVTPEQKVDEFIREQNFFNPAEFNKEILSKEPDDFLQEMYQNLSDFAKANEVSVIDAIVGFSQKQRMLLPGISISLLNTICPLMCDIETAKQV